MQFVQVRLVLTKSVFWSKYPISFQVTMSAYSGKKDSIEVGKFWWIVVSRAVSVVLSLAVQYRTVPPLFRVSASAQYGAMRVFSVGNSLGRLLPGSSLPRDISPFV